MSKIPSVEPIERQPDNQTNSMLRNIMEELTCLRLEIRALRNEMQKLAAANE